MYGLGCLRTRGLPAFFAVLLVPPLAIHLVAAGGSGRSAVPVSAGVVASNGVAHSLPPGQVGVYVPGSSVLVLPDGRIAQKNAVDEDDASSTASIVCT